MSGHLVAPVDSAHLLFFLCVYVYVHGVNLNNNLHVFFLSFCFCAWSECVSLAAVRLNLQVYGRGGFPVPVTEVPLMLLIINYALAT